MPTSAFCRPSSMGYKYCEHLNNKRSTSPSAQRPSTHAASTEASRPRTASYASRSATSTATRPRAKGAASALSEEEAYLASLSRTDLIRMCKQFRNITPSYSKDKQRLVKTLGGALHGGTVTKQPSPPGNGSTSGLRTTTRSQSKASPRTTTTQGSEKRKPLFMVEAQKNSAQSRWFRKCVEGMGVDLHRDDATIAARAQLLVDVKNPLLIGQWNAFVEGKIEHVVRDLDGHLYRASAGKRSSHVNRIRDATHHGAGGEEDEEQRERLRARQETAIASEWALMRGVEQGRSYIYHIWTGVKPDQLKEEYAATYSVAGHIATEEEEEEGGGPEAPERTAYVAVDVDDANLLKLKFYLAEKESETFVFAAEAACIQPDQWITLNSPWRKKLVTFVRKADGSIDSCVIDKACYVRNSAAAGCSLVDPYVCRYCGTVRNNGNFVYVTKDDATMKRGKYFCKICTEVTPHFPVHSRTEFRPKPHWDPTTTTRQVQYSALNDCPVRTLSK